MTRFVLIHGSWQSGNAWSETARHLTAAGHTVFTPTIAGHGNDGNKAVNHAQCTQSIVDYVVSHDLRDFALVGHSFGGTIIAKVAEVMPERIRRLVFCNAFVLRDGNSLLDEIPPAYRELFGQLVEQSADDTVMVPFPLWREAFINDADLDLAQSTYASLLPEPYQPFRDKLDMKKFYSLEIPRSFLNCTEDIALPPGDWGWHPRMFGRLGLCRLVQMPGSHAVLLTNPKGLAAKLIEAARD